MTSFSQFQALCEQRGLKLVKARPNSRLGKTIIRYLLKDKHGWVYLRNLDDVRRKLRSVAANEVRTETGDKLRAALESAGVEFTNGAAPGVRLRRGRK